MPSAGRENQNRKQKEKSGLSGDSVTKQTAVTQSWDRKKVVLAWVWWVANAKDSVTHFYGERPRHNHKCFQTKRKRNAYKISVEI